LFDFGVGTTAVECDRRNLLLTIITRCGDNTWYKAKVDQEAGQLHCRNGDVLVITALHMQLQSSLVKWYYPSIKFTIN